jgi:cellulose synthase (UDP-forming)
LSSQWAIVCISFGLAILWMMWLRESWAWARRLVFVVWIVLAARYFYWRATSGLPSLGFDLGHIFVYAYFAFELWSGTRTYRSLRLFQRRSSRLATADANERWYQRLPRVPLVDVFIPTYNEGLDILEKAIVSAKAQDYAHTWVWVLDDGRRDWLREYADKMQVGYITRAENVGFKAGNLNNALRHVRGLSEVPDFILVLDCDFVAKPALVRRTMNLMREPDVGIVQTPQIYYNQDPFQYALGAAGSLPDWMRSPFDHYLPCLDVVGGVKCIGTCFLIRRPALDQIGGFPTESVTEDSLTTLKLNRFGYRTIYLNEQLSFGIVAEGLRELLTQCGRWCLGGVQIMHSEWGPFAKDVPIAARLFDTKRTKTNSDIEEAVSWGIFSGLQIFNVWMTILFLFTGMTVLPMVSSVGDEYVMYFVPYWTLQMAAFSWLTSGAELPIVGDARYLVGAPVVVRATIRGLFRSKNHRFDVTDKGAIRTSVIVHWRLLRWLLLTGSLTVGGMVYVTFDAHAPVNLRGFGGVALFWGYYNLAILAVAAAVCIEPPKRRVEERFSTSERAQIHVENEASEAQLRDISLDGAALSTSVSLGLGQALELELREVGRIPATVARVGSWGVGLKFDPSNPHRERLIRVLFSDAYIRVVRKADVAGICRALWRRAVS